MQETEIIAAARKTLGNKGIALSGMDADGFVYAIGIGNGKMVTVKLQGPEQEEQPADIDDRGLALANSISGQLAGL